MIIDFCDNLNTYIFFYLGLFLNVPKWKKLAINQFTLPGQRVSQIIIIIFFKRKPYYRDYRLHIMHCARATKNIQNIKR